SRRESGAQGRRRAVAPDARFRGHDNDREWRENSGLQNAAADLVKLDRFEEGAEVAFAETLVALALADLEEDRTDDRLGEDLEQQAAVARLRLGRAVDEDAAAAQAGEVLAMAGQALVDHLVIGVGRVEELDARAGQPLDRRVDVVRAERDVLDALAAIGR